MNKTPATNSPQPRIRLAATGLLFLLCTPLLAQSGAVEHPVMRQFHVSPSGNDADAGTQAKPFATLERARDAVRAINAKMTGDIVVELDSGTYALTNTLTFDHRDSATGGHTIIYRAASSGGATLSGGRKISGWQPDTDGRWKAPAGLDNFRQLYVDGKRAVRAKGGELPDAELRGADGYRTSAAAMAEWKNQSDIELCFAVVWCHTRCKVQRITREGDHAVVAMMQPSFSNARTKEGVQVDKPTTVENALELLDEPGEWYLDRAAKTVYYKPLPGQDMSKVHVTAPAVERLIDLRGTLDHPAANLRFEGIVFAEAGWLQPSEAGLVDVQANLVLNPQKPLRRDGKLTAVHNEQLKSPANVVCHATKGIRFERCTFTRLGGAGIDVEAGARNTLVSGCRFFDISGSAIQIGDVLTDDHHPDDPRKIVKDNAAVNNFIHDCCLEYWGGVGVFAGYTEGTIIAHNEITRLPYSGISAGWGWGEEDAGGGAAEYQQPFKYDAPTPAKNICIEHNHIHEVMRALNDGAGIYTLGNMPGTVIRGNHIHSNPGVPGGIYFDEGSGFIEVAGNVIENASTPLNFNNRVQDRIATCNTHDNHIRAEDASDRSPEAKRVIGNAGLSPEYRDLLAP